MDILIYTPNASIPQCYIQSFDVPALNKSLNSPHNTSIYLELKLEDKYLTDSYGICYDDISLTLSYYVRPLNDYYCNNVNSCIATSTIPKFCQGRKTVKNKKAVFVMKADQLANDEDFGFIITNLTSINSTMEFASRQLLDINDNNTANFQVNLTTFTEAKMPIFINKHRQSFKVGAIVEVNNQLGINNKVVQLSGSSAYEHRPLGLLVVFLVMFIILVIA